jgi:hypothetical protein
MQNSRLDSLISIRSDNAKLINALSLVQPRLTTGSLAAYNGFDFNELHQFMQIFIKISITQLLVARNFQERCLSQEIGYRY